MLGKLLRASDGSIPFVPIMVGIIIGAIAMFAYAKFWKPKILFDRGYSFTSASRIPRRIDENGDDGNNNNNNNLAVAGPQQHPQAQPVMTTIDATALSQPAFIDIRQMAAGQIPIPMPQLQTMYDQQEYDDEPDDDEQSDDRDDVEQNDE